MERAAHNSKNGVPDRTINMMMMMMIKVFVTGAGEVG